MKLLDKKSIAVDVAKQRKTDIDTGVALAQKIDALRETLAQEEGNLRRFRESTVTQAQSEIDELVRQKNNVRHDIQKRQEELVRLRQPLDAEWTDVHFAQAKLSKWEIELSGREVYISQTQRETERHLQDVIYEEARLKTLKDRAIDAYTEAQDALESATTQAAITRSKANQILDNAKTREKDISLRENDVTEREMDIEDQQQDIVEHINDIANRERTLKDRYATLEKTINRLNKK